MNGRTVLLILCLPAACGDQTASITTPTLPASLTGLNLAPELRVSPSPVPAEPSSDPSFEWEIAFDATLRDVADRGIRIDVAVLTVNEGAGVEVFSRPVADIVPGFSPTIPVGGSATWVFRNVRYALPSDGRDASGNIYLELETGVGDFRTMNFGFAIR